MASGRCGLPDWRASRCDEQLCSLSGHPLFPPIGESSRTLVYPKPHLVTRPRMTLKHRSGSSVLVAPYTTPSLTGIDRSFSCRGRRASRVAHATLCTTTARRRRHNHGYKEREVVWGFPSTTAIGCRYRRRHYWHSPVGAAAVARGGKSINTQAISDKQRKEAVNGSVAAAVAVRAGAASAASIANRKLDCGSKAFSAVHSYSVRLSRWVQGLDGAWLG